MQVKSTELKNLPNRERLFLKKWQSNGFYPIEIAERNPDGWFTFSVKNGRTCGALFYMDKIFLLKLQKNLYLVSDTPMKNINKFNYE